MHQSSENCTKNSNAEKITASILYMDDPQRKQQNIAMSELSPKRLLQKDAPGLIDNCQLAPKLGDAIRFEVDYQKELGQFVLTGSRIPAETKEMTHSGIGPFAWVTTRTMSLYESEDSTGEVSLKELFDGKVDIVDTSKLHLEHLAFLVCRER